MGDSTVTDGMDRFSFSLCLFSSRAVTQCEKRYMHVVATWTDVPNRLDRVLHTYDAIQMIRTVSSPEFWCITFLLYKISSVAREGACGAQPDTRYDPREHVPAVRTIGFLKKSMHHRQPPDREIGNVRMGTLEILQVERSNILD